VTDQVTVAVRIPVIDHSPRGSVRALASAYGSSRVFQEPAASPIPLTGAGPGSAFTGRTHAKQRHVFATRSLTTDLILQ